MLSSIRVSRSESILLLPISTWNNSFQSQQLQLSHPWVKSGFVLWPYFAPAVQHCDFSAFNNSDRSPQHPVTALHCEMSFWQLQVSGWWVQQPSPMGSEVLGQYPTEQIWRPHWTRRQPNPGGTDTWSQLQKLKLGKPTQMSAYLTYLLECPLGKIPWYYIIFKHFTLSKSQVFAHKANMA